MEVETLVAGAGASRVSDAKGYASKEEVSRLVAAHLNLGEGGR